MRGTVCPPGGSTRGSVAHLLGLRRWGFARSGECWNNTQHDLALRGPYGNSGPSTLSPAQLRTLTASAACARKNGLPGFPDPPYQTGELDKLGFRKTSPRMEAATKACHSQALAAGVVQTPGVFDSTSGRCSRSRSACAPTG